MLVSGLNSLHMYINPPNSTVKHYCSHHLLWGGGQILCYMKFPSQGHTARMEPLRNLVLHLTNLKTMFFGTLLNCLIIFYFHHYTTLYYLSLYLGTNINIWPPFLGKQRYLKDHFV